MGALPAPSALPTLGPPLGVSANGRVGQGPWSMTGILKDAVVNWPLMSSGFCSFRLCARHSGKGSILHCPHRTGYSPLSTDTLSPSCFGHFSSLISWFMWFYSLSINFITMLAISAGRQNCCQDTLHPTCPGVHMRSYANTSSPNSSIGATGLDRIKHPGHGTKM